jgi:hypothetical protein
MRKSLFAYCRFFAHLLPLSGPLIQQYFFYTRNIKPIIKKWSARFPDSASDKELKRLLFFGVFIPVMQGNGFTLLRAEKMNKKERLTMTLFATATPLFDDFFDDNFSNPEELEDFFQLRENYQPKHPKSILLFELLLAIKPLLAHPETFVEIAYQVYKAQQYAHKIQSNSSSDTNSVYIASMDKCEKSCLLFGEILNLLDVAQAKLIILQCGLLIQFTDDIFDLYMDHQNGIHTIATRTTNIKELEQHFILEWDKLKQLCQAIPEKNRKRFMNFQWFFFSRTIVALEHLKNIQTRENFDITSFSRSQLVCDMAKPINFHRWVKAFNASK